MGNYKDHMHYAARGAAQYAILVLIITTVCINLGWVGGAAFALKWSLFWTTGIVLWFAGAMLPDIDSPQSKPSQLAKQVFALFWVIVGFGTSFLICVQFLRLSLRQSLPYLFVGIVLGFAGNWVLTSRIVSKTMHHRGRTHSIVASLVYGSTIAAIFLIGGIEWYFVLMVGSMATFGYINHLICDEIFSAEPERARQFMSWRFIFWDPDGKKKRSAGTALKWWSHRTEKLKDG